MFLKESHTVPKSHEKLRVLDYACDIFNTYATRTAMKKAIKRGELYVNGEKSGGAQWVDEGMTLELYDLEHQAPKEYHLDLDVLFEDDEMAVIWKPAGIEVSGNKFKTIENALVGQLKPSTASDALKWPKPVHRLDKPTTGLLVIAKTGSSIVKLSDTFKERNVRKIYRALVIGDLLAEGLITAPIDDQEAKTFYKTIEQVPSLKCGTLSLLEVELFTGRTHQIRKHLSGLGYPILGDSLYGKEGLIRSDKGLFLSAVELFIPHPKSEEELHIKAPQPAKFDSYIKREQRRFDKWSS